MGHSVYDGRIQKRQMDIAYRACVASRGINNTRLVFVLCQQSRVDIYLSHMQSQSLMTLQSSGHVNTPVSQSLVRSAAESVRRPRCGLIMMDCFSRCFADWTSLISSYSNNCLGTK